MWVLLMGNVAFGLESFSVARQDHHQNESFQVGVEPHIFLSVGGTSGLSVSSNNGAFIGVETALSRINGNRLMGLSADALWDTGLGGVSATVGPRFGVLMFAIDGGISVRHDFDRPTEVGSQIRTLLNLGFGSIYYRVGFWPSAEELSTVHQFGFSLKFPQQFGYKPRTGVE